VSRDTIEVSNNVNVVVVVLHFRSFFQTISSHLSHQLPSFRSMSIDPLVPLLLLLPAVADSLPIQSRQTSLRRRRRYDLDFDLFRVGRVSGTRHDSDRVQLR